MVRELLFCETIDQALEYLHSVPHNIPNNFVLAHKDDGICDVECFPSSVHVIRAENKLCHSNHVLTETKKEKDVQLSENPANISTFNRLKVMQELVDKNNVPLQ